MKLFVIISDLAAAANIGGSVETWIKEFLLPDEIAEYIKANQDKGKWTTVSFALSAEDRPSS